jgi:DNA replication and checkpoint protein
MEDDKQLLEKKSVQLRQELKVWEKQFSNDNGGRKAGREDIKADSSTGMCRTPFNMQPRH